MAVHDNSWLGPVADSPRLVSKRQNIKTLRDNSFSTNGPRLFNLLPKELKEIETLPIFKSHLDKFLKNFPDDDRTQERNPTGAERQRRGKKPKLNSKNKKIK